MLTKLLDVSLILLAIPDELSMSLGTVDHDNDPFFVYKNVPELPTIRPCDKS
jgi:hypothetical protein